MKNLWLMPMLFLLVAPMFAQTAELPSESGNAFLRTCSVIEQDDMAHLQVPQMMNSLSCLAYVDGFTDGVAMERALAQTADKRDAPRSFCTPKNVETPQVVRIVMKYIRNNPEEAHKPTAFLIVKALEKAYPCPRK